MMQRICSLAVLIFTLNIAANGQGTPGTLRCNLRGGLEIHASRDPGSSLIGRVQCGDAVLIIDQRFGSPHIRTEDGKDGYITSQNLGQWSLIILAATEYKLRGVSRVSDNLYRTEGEAIYIETRGCGHRGSFEDVTIVWEGRFGRNKITWQGGETCEVVDMYRKVGQ